MYDALLKPKTNFLIVWVSSIEIHSYKPGNLFQRISHSCLSASSGCYLCWYQQCVWPFTAIYVTSKTAGRWRQLVLRPRHQSAIVITYIGHFSLIFR